VPDGAAGAAVTAAATSIMSGVLPDWGHLRGVWGALASEAQHDRAAPMGILELIYGAGAVSLVPTSMSVSLAESADPATVHAWPTLAAAMSPAVPARQTLLLHGANGDGGAQSVISLDAEGWPLSWITDVPFGLWQGQLTIAIDQPIPQHPVNQPEPRSPSTTPAPRSTP
jgi:hypothetical protein